MSTLYIVATPIGNLEDISSRALRILSGVDLILCEDTRKTKKLLNHFGIKNRTLSYHQHSKIKKTEKIMGFLEGGKNLALVSDSGSPGISDPGNNLIDKLKERLGDKVKVVPVPGPSALISLASVSGFPMNKFLFLGFAPAKRKRNKFFKKIAGYDYPVILYESPHRILKTLKEIKEATGNRELVVGRELTKKFETIYRGNIDEVTEKIKKDKKKGEFTIVINRKK